MFARLITIVAALLLACASPQASAYVRAERVSVSFADIANSAAPETALPAQIACKSKTAPPARADLEYPASGENAALNHWHTWGNPLSPEKPTSGNRDWLWDSAPFGDTAANEQPTAGLPNFTFNLRFPRQQYDRETGTHYNYFRDYEAGSGRYVQSDPVGLFGGFDSFSYVDGSPTDLFDPDGLSARGPKPGLRGPHNQTIRSVAACIKRGKGRILAGGKQGVRGDKLKEAVIDIPGGGVRRPDIVFKPKGCANECYVNVGRHASGRGGPRAPVPREQRAMSDLTAASMNGTFVPYNDPTVMNGLMKDKCKQILDACI